MLKQIRKNNQGFTIIEVMIVLAIAGLILLVVFLAVPALQRSQRNSARKTDASRIAAGIVDFTSNSSTGALPISAIDCATVYNSSANLAQFAGFTSIAGNPPACTAANVNTAGPASIADKNIYLAFASPTAANYTAPTPAAGASYISVIIIGDQVTCNGSNAWQTSGATSRSVSLLYTLESGSSYAWACTNPQ